MELESRQQPRVTRVSDTERETAVGLLRRAAGEGRLRLEEFSDRVGIALAADTIEQLDSATAGIDKTPELPSAGPHGILGDMDVRTPAPGEEPPSWWEWFKGSRRRRRVRGELPRHGN
jgi:Domain of unknown function (DUF1707)